MQIAFVSSCPIFFNGVTEPLSKIHPNLRFTHFETFEDFTKSNNEFFSLLLVKIQSDLKEISGLKAFQRLQPDLVVVLLVHGLNLSFKKYNLGKIDFIFEEKEVIEKLNHYFYSVANSPSPKNFLNPVVEFHINAYIQLKPELSSIMYLNSLGHTAIKIGETLNKSPRTIEKQLEKLKEIFKVNTKIELKEVYHKLQETKLLERSLA